MLSPSGGRQHLTSHVFSRPQSSLPLVRFLPALWNAGASVLPTDTETVNAVALGERSGDSREAWALLETRIQRWRIVDEGWEDLLFDEDVLNLCRAGVREAFPYAPLDDAGLGIELLDLAIVKCAELIPHFPYRNCRLTYASRIAPENWSSWYHMPDQTTRA